MLDIKEKVIAFFIHQGENDFETEDILQALQTYKSFNEYNLWVISRETQPYIHFHVFCKMDIADYNAFIANYVSKSSKNSKWKLRGRCQGGLPKQYGKVSHIKKHDKMLAYTIKQGIYKTNIPEELMKPYKEMSYTKDTGDNDREIREKLRDYIDKVYYKDQYKAVQDEPLKKAIIHFLLKEKIRIRTSSQIDGYFKYMRQFSNHDFIRKDCELYFYDLLYNNF